MAVAPTLTEQEIASLQEIPHPSVEKGASIYGSTKVFPDYQAEEGESYFTLVHGIAHESSVSFVAVLQATRALRKGFESALYFYGPGALNCLATRGFPTTGDSALPRRAQHQRPARRRSSARAARCTAAGSACRCTARARRTSSRASSRRTRSTCRTRVIHYARKGAIINSTYMV